jgi:hypothetical protein
VGLGEICSEDVDRVLANVGHLDVKAGNLLGALLILARSTGASSALTLKSAQLAETTFESSRVSEFADYRNNCRYGRQTSHAHVDADNRIGLGDTGLLWTIDRHSNSGDDSITMS